MKKGLLVTVITVLISITAIAQSKHELSVSGFGGLQGLNYSLGGTTIHNADVSKNFGGGGGLGYAYNFNQNWAIQTGIDFSYYSSKAEIGTIDGTYKQGNDIYTYTTTNYEETQKLLNLEIPVMARYTAILDGSNALQFAGGLKIGFPISKKYNASADGHLTKSAWLDFERVLYEFGNIPGGATPAAVKEHSGDFESNISVQLQLEAGYKYSFSERVGLYAGLYFQYGLNNMQKKDDGNLVTFAGNSSMNTSLPVSNYDESLLNTNMVDSFRPMAIGLKLRLSFGL